MGTPCSRNSGIVKPLSTELAAISTLNTNYDVIDAALAKGKWDATADPAVTDDSGDGYAIGSIWVNTTGHKVFIAEAVTVGAAVWRQVWPALVADMTCLPGGVYWQALINGSFQINQQSVATYTSATTPANSDDTYLHDQWILLSDGNDIVDVSAESSVIPTGGSASAKFEVETANKKFGYLQIIENKDAIKYAGKVASLQFKARTVTGKVIENVRAVVLSWNGTADAVTSDVVASWGAEGANPTWAANWTAENTASNLTLVADTWTTYKIENIAIDTASMANLAVLIWVDDTDAAVDDLLYISDVQLNQGPVCLPYMPISFVQDLWKCYRFWESSYAYGVAPGTPNSGAGLALLVGVGVGAAQYLGRGFRQPKPGPTEITVYSYIGTINKVSDTGSTDVGTSCVSVNTNRDAFRKVTDASNPFTIGAFYQAHWVADARL